jgi:hypothetical protein
MKVDQTALYLDLLQEQILIARTTACSTARALIRPSSLSCNIEKHTKYELVQNVN